MHGYQNLTTVLSHSSICLAFPLAESVFCGCHYSLDWTTGLSYFPSFPIPKGILVMKQDECDRK